MQLRQKSKLFREIINKVGSYIIEADFVQVAVEVNNHYWLFTQEEEFDHPDGVLSELEMYAANIVNTEFPEIEDATESFFQKIKSVINKFVCKDAPPIPELRPKKKSAKESESSGVEIINLNDELVMAEKSPGEISISEGVKMSDAIKNLSDSD